MNINILINSLRVAAVGAVLLLPRVSPACTFSLSFASTPVAAAGGAATVAVYTQPACAWSVQSGHAWLSIQGARQGRGNGAFTFYVAPNSTRQARSGFYNGLHYVPDQGNCLARGGCIPAHYENAFRLNVTQYAR